MAWQEVSPLGLLFKRGQSWQEAGQLHQAVATYFRLVEYFPQAYEAQRAREELLNLAQRFEEEGKVHTATNIYNRLAAYG